MPKNEKKTVWVAMSGGVDSSVAALLLKRQGYQVVGVYMKNWSDPLADECPWQQDIKDFHAVCKKLQIPARLEIFEEQYRQKVVKYLINGYKKGLTPNPDMLCNSEIKFKLFLAKAKKMGADLIATGHYVIKSAKNNKYFLSRALDDNKDQSYFLSLLTQNQLKYSLFPIGNYTKPRVRALAKKAGLSVFNKKDSQGICFIGQVKFKDFIRQFIKSNPGEIRTTNNKLIGRHDGLFFYTIGQRHGLGIGGGIPYFVTSKNTKTNTLIVGRGLSDKTLFNNLVYSKNTSWVSGSCPKLPYKCQARIRYRQPLYTCKIVRNSQGILETAFNKPQRAIAPGQFIVFYNKREMLGGGQIVLRP